MELIILAAGMGSRFGGLKQIEPIDDYGNYILDYSIYDSIKAGFTKVIFVIKEEMYEHFKDTIGKRIEGKIQVEYAFQKAENIFPSRTKPWGTAHAVLSAREFITGNFLIINSDDFYGKNSFSIAKQWLETLEHDKEYDSVNLTYKVAQTMTQNGKVKRGVCVCDENNKLIDIVESEIYYDNNQQIIAKPLNKQKHEMHLKEETLVSMNMFVFRKKFMDILSDEFRSFIVDNKDNLSTCEFLTTDVVSSMIKKNKMKVKIVDSESIWYGVTYIQDKEHVKNKLQELVVQGIYKKGLWQ